VAGFRVTAEGYGIARIIGRWYKQGVAAMPDQGGRARESRRQEEILGQETPTVSHLRGSSADRSNLEKQGAVKGASTAGPTLRYAKPFSGIRVASLGINSEATDAEATS